MDHTVGGMLGQEMVEEMLEKILPQKGGTYDIIVDRSMSSSSLHILAIETG